LCYHRFDNYGTKYFHLSVECKCVLDGVLISLFQLILLRY